MPLLVCPAVLPSMRLEAFSAVKSLRGLKRFSQTLHILPSEPGIVAGHRTAVVVDRKESGPDNQRVG